MPFRARETFMLCGTWTRPNIMDESLQEIISRLWSTPEHAEWTPKTDVLALKRLSRPLDLIGEIN